MAIELVMPKLGMAMSEGEVVKWLVDDGKLVQAGDPVVQVMSKKITYQVTASEAGTVQQVAQPKTKWPVNAVVGYILLAGEEPMAVPNSGPLEGVGLSEVDNETHFTDRPQETFVLSTPMAKRLAKDHGISLSQVSGTGPQGRIQEHDVLAYLESSRGSQTLTGKSETAGPVEHLVPFEGMRGAIAERMTASLKQSAQLTLHTEVDVTSLWDTRAVYHQNVPSFTALLAVVVARTLLKHPRMNATIMDDGIHLWPEVNLGMAVALDEGLIVPVIHHAQTLSVEHMVQEIRRLSEKARANQLSVDEVTGGTFTMTNLGMYGIDAFTPIINSPETAILGVGRIVQKPVMKEGGLACRQFVTLSLTIDHRAVDGAPAAQFLQTLSQRLTYPGLLWIEGQENESAKYE